MKASLRWISDLLGTPLEVREALDRFPMLGVPVDGLEPLHHDLGQVIVAEVLEVARHPNADRLSLCKVNTGSAVVGVVCGAKNVTAGRRYPFAAVGTTLPGGLVLERRKIRGEYSDGMLCSARELRLGDDHEGILELDTAAPPGTPFLEAVPIADTRLELDVSPNRPDLLCHVGLARDLGAALGRSVKLPAFADAAGARFPRAARAAGAAGATDGVRVTIEDAEGCPRYLAAVVRGARVGPSPDWLRRRLEAAGSRSINNIVDATNYILLEVGQPLHAFDLAKLAGPAIVVRKARAGEGIVTLDGVRRALTPAMTVIADERDAQGVAGAMGGAASEVSAGTTDILLECAYFDPRRTRATRRGLGLVTEASHRFERGVDHDALPDHLARALDLLVQVAGGTVAGVPVDVYPSPIPPTTIFLRDRRVVHLLGVEIPRAEIERVLTVLGCVVSPKGGGDRLAVQVPTYRPDLTREVDLIEELARIVGYERFPDEMRPQRLGVVPDAPAEQLASRLRRVFTSLGLHEAILSSLGPRHDERCVEVANPLSQEEGYLRAALLPGLVRQVEHNWRMQEREVRLFEIGTVFLRGGGPLPSEELHVAAVLSGARRPPHWSEPAPPDVDRFDAKLLLEAAVAQARPGAVVVAEGDRLVAKEAGDRQVGWAGELAADRPAWGAPLYGFELEVLVTAAVPAQFRSLSAWPSVEQDVALVLPETLAAAEVDASLRTGAGPLLETLWPFDEYRGAPLQSGTRSVAWRLVFRAADRTLRDSEVEAAVTRALAEVERRHGVRRREA